MRLAPALVTALTVAFALVLVACPQRPARHLLGDGCGREGEPCCDEGPCYPGLGCASGTCQFLASAKNTAASPPPPKPTVSPPPSNTSPKPLPSPDAGTCASTDMGEGSKGLSLCGVPTNEVQCGGGMYACKGICGQGPVCFARQSCCADSCMAFDGPRNLVCPNDMGTLDGIDVPCDGAPGLVPRNVGCAAKGGKVCADNDHCIGQDQDCCNGGNPAFNCGAGATCAPSKRGGFCCTSKRHLGAQCASDAQCATGSCAGKICRRSPCLAGGTTCATHADCCAGFICGAGMKCVAPPPEVPQQLR